MNIKTGGMDQLIFWIEFPIDLIIGTEFINNIAVVLSLFIDSFINESVTIIVDPVRNSPFNVICRSHRTILLTVIGTPPGIYLTSVVLEIVVIVSPGSRGAGLTIPIIVPAVHHLIV